MKRASAREKINLNKCFILIIRKNSKSTDPDGVFIASHPTVYISDPSDPLTLPHIMHALNSE